MIHYKTDYKPLIFISNKRGISKDIQCRSVRILIIFMRDVNEDYDHTKVRDEGKRWFYID